MRRAQAPSQRGSAVTRLSAAATASSMRPACRSATVRASCGAAAQLLQAPRLGRDRLDVGVLAERGTVPQGEGRVEERHRVCAVGSHGVAVQRFEACEVDRFGSCVQGVARAAAHQRVPEHSAQTRYVGADRRDRARGQIVVPHGFGERVDRHRLAEPGDEHREDPSRFRTTERDDVPAGVEQLHRTENPQLHGDTVRFPAQGAASAIVLQSGCEAGPAHSSQNAAIEPLWAPIAARNDRTETIAGGSNVTITAPSRTRDAHGNEISGAAEQVAAYDHALDRLLRYHPDLVPAAEAIAADPAALPMGQVFMAYLMLMTTDVPDVQGAA